MSKFCCKYNPDYWPSDLPWYERYGLMTWYDQIKYTKFSRNPDEHLKKNV